MNEVSRQIETASVSGKNPNSICYLVAQLYRWGNILFGQMYSNCSPYTSLSERINSRCGEILFAQIQLQNRSNIII